MGTNNALEIIKKRVKDNPKLEKAYLEEKKNYQISYKVRECRKKRGLSQKKLAELIGTQQSVISRLEMAEYTGHSLPILQKISNVLHVPIETFIVTETQPTTLFKLHSPLITRKAASFEGWNTRRQVIKRVHAR